MNVKKLIVACAMLISTTAFAQDKIPAGKYNIDPAHSKVGFEIGHLVISTVDGRFNQFEGVLDINEKAEKSKANVSIDVSSVDTGNAKRDEHLKSADFFDAAKFPKMTFVSKKVVQDKAGLKLVGTLKIKNVTKDVTLDVKYLGDVKDGYGQEKVAFSAQTEISRKDFGIVYGSVVEKGPVIGDKVKIILSVQAAKEVKKEAAKK